MNFKLLISIFFICFFSASCAGKKVKTQTKTKPTISIETAELRTSMKNPHQGFIVIDMQLKNSSQLNVSCQNYELKPTLSGTKVELKEVQNNVDFKLSAGETANLPLMVPLSQNLVEFDPKSDQERPSFNAKFNGKLKCGAQTVVLDFENEFIIPAFPILQIGKIDISRSRDGDMGFDISLRLMNNNPIEMSLTEGEAKFVLEGLEIANHPIYIDRIPPSSAIDAALALNEELLKENIPKFRKLKIFNYEADLRYKIVGSDKDYHLHLKGQTSF